MLNENINACGLSLYSSDRNCSLAWCFSKQTVLFTWGDDVIFDIANSNIIDIDYWSRSITHFSIMKLYKNNNPPIIISAAQVCHHLHYFFCISCFENQSMWYTNSLPDLLSWAFLSNIIPKIQNYERFILSNKSLSDSWFCVELG